MTNLLRHRTKETSREVIAELTRSTREEFFTCHIILHPRESKEINTLKIDLKRTNSGHSYETANGDRIYHTTARFHGDLREFDVDVISRSRAASTVGATLSLSSRSLEIFADIKHQLELGR